MTLRNLMASLSVEAAPYPEDVFSSYPYVGNGGALTVNNGIDLSGEGGLVWIKNRSATNYHVLQDTIRGANKTIMGAAGGQEATESLNFSFLGDGFSQNNANGKTNTNGHYYHSWSFRQASRFFDVVTYTGTGSPRVLAHNLGVTPGLILATNLDLNNNLFVYHKNTSASKYLALTTAAAAVVGSSPWGSEPTATGFSVNNAAETNFNGYRHVAYLFAHDPSPEGIIYCGDFTFNAADVEVNIGWEPQFVMVKNASSNTGGGENWSMFDMVRGMPVANPDFILNANLSNAETSANVLEATATGFRVKAAYSTGGPHQYIYMAIRRPMKVPTAGSEVFSPVLWTSDSVSGRKITTGILTDMIFGRQRTSTDTAGIVVADRLRGKPPLYTGNANAEDTVTSGIMPVGGVGNGFSFVDGFGVGNGSNAKLNYATSNPVVGLAFKRASEFFDTVCWYGTGGTPVPIAHNLGVIPDVVIEKNCTTTGEFWYATYPWATDRVKLRLDSTSGHEAAGTFDNTATTFIPVYNAAGNRYIAYLFATLPGISKWGFYIGNGTSQTINCGFTTGARFVLIKKVSGTGNWFLWDTARGIVTGTDPVLTLNTTGAEVTSRDDIDPTSVGFVVNEVSGGNINTSSSTYIYLAIA